MSHPVTPSPQSTCPPSGSGCSLQPAHWSEHVKHIHSATHTGEYRGHTWGREGSTWVTPRYEGSDSEGNEKAATEAVTVAILHWHAIAATVERKGVCVCGMLAWEQRE